MQYADGQEVRLGDLVDLSSGKGHTAQVLVLVCSGEAVAGIDAREWDYFHDGVLLDDFSGADRLHLTAFGDEHILLARNWTGPRKA